jgi:hypothetical protein
MGFNSLATHFHDPKSVVISSMLHLGHNGSHQFLHTFVLAVWCTLVSLENSCTCPMFAYLQCSFGPQDEPRTNCICLSLSLHLPVLTSDTLRPNKGSSRILADRGPVKDGLRTGAVLPVLYKAMFRARMPSGDCHGPASRL